MPTTKTKSTQELDQRIAKVLSHPLRQRILTVLNEKVSSPSDIARELGERLGTVSYHTRMLLESDCVELVKTEPRRGALEHYYRAIRRPYFDDAHWARMPVNLRRQLYGPILENIGKDVAAAAAADGFDLPDIHLSRTLLELDEQGWQEVSSLLTETLDRALELMAEAAGRRVEPSEEERTSVSSEVVLMHFTTTR